MRSRGSAARLERCEVSGNRLGGVDVSEEGSAELVACKIHHGQDSGVLVYDKGAVRMVRTDVWGNKLSLEVCDEASAELVGCKCAPFFYISIDLCLFSFSVRVLLPR